MTNLRGLAFLLLPAAIAACNNSSSGTGGGNEPPAASASAAISTTAPSASAMAAPSASAGPSASAAATGPTIGRHAGLAGMLLRSSLDLDGLTDAQKDGIGKLATPLDADDARAAFRTFQTDLAAGVRAGKIDSAKVQADEAAIDKAAQASQQKQADTLDGLHGLLTADQRKALTAAVRAKQAAREAHGPPPMMADAGAVDWQKRQLDRMTRDLGLDDGQQKQVTALMAKSPAPTPAAMQAKHDDMKKRWDAVLTAFEPDSFSAKKLDLSMGGKPHDEMEKRVTFVTGLLPILRPDQRDKFASTIERAHGPEGGPGHPGHNEGEVDQGTDFEVP